jgi:RNA polymerase-binding transcription factor DksA
MTGSELAELRGELVARLRQIIESHRPDRVAAAENEIGREPQDEGDEGFLDDLDVILGDLDDREEHFARKLTDALQRMRDGEYGRCIDCDREIPIERLRAVPWAERCAEDQAIADRAVEHPTL